MWGGDGTGCVHGSSGPPSLHSGSAPHTTPHSSQDTGHRGGLDAEDLDTQGRRRRLGAHPDRVSGVGLLPLWEAAGTEISGPGMALPHSSAWRWGANGHPHASPSEEGNTVKESCRVTSKMISRATVRQLFFQTHGGSSSPFRGGGSVLLNCPAMAQT